MEEDKKDVAVEPTESTEEALVEETVAPVEETKAE